MKLRLTLIGTMAVACATIQLTAMSTEEETRQAEPLVQKMLASERAALESRKKTCSEVAAAAMKLSSKADTDAVKLLLMKGAFAFYVQDGNLKEAAETMNALKAAIPDIPPQSVTNIIETALVRVPKKEDGAQLYKLIDKAKAESTTEKTRKDIAKLFPGWSLDSEVPQENRKDWASGFCANHRGQDNVLRLHPVNKKTPVVLSRTVTLSNKNPCLLLKVASWDEGSDFLLSVRVNGKYAMPNQIVCTSDLEPWEDLVVPLSDWRGSSVKIEIILSANNWWCEWSHFARIEIAEGNGLEKVVAEAKKTFGGYTWSYRVYNDEATIVSKSGVQFACAVSPKPTGHVSIPPTLNYIKVVNIGRESFRDCGELESVTIPEGIRAIGPDAFKGCRGLRSVTIPSGVKSIGRGAFFCCSGLTAVTFQEGVEVIGQGVFSYCTNLTSVTIPSSVTNIGTWAFSDCSRLKSVTILGNVRQIGSQAIWNCPELTSVTIRGERPDAPNDIFKKCGKLKSIHVPANAKSWAGMKTWQGIPLVFDVK